jgi:GMP synthase-like glutamine amidotransferase
VLHVLQHHPREGPERIGSVARSLGLGVVVHALHAGQPVPEKLAPADLLVVMGGSMGVGDIGDPRWPFLAGEVGLLGRLLRSERPVLGVCLGAQLLAHAAGASVRPLTVGDPPVLHREVGWGPVEFVRTAEEEPVLGGLHQAEVVLHWHGDTFDLPPGATLLASTLACPHQMFRLGQRAFGIQFHVEMTAELVNTWVEEDGDYVRLALGPEGAARILADTRRHSAQHERMGDRLIRNLLEAMLA